MPYENGMHNGSTFVPDILAQKEVASHIHVKKIAAPQMDSTDSSPTISSSVLHSDLPSTFVSGFHDEASVRRMRYNKLGATGMDVSALAIGGGGLERFYRSLDEDHAIESIHLGLRLGLNYIHTAPWYGGGKSEALLGKALMGIPRQAFFIATKVGRYSGTVEEMFDFSAKRVIHSVEESLNRLGLAYVDVIQIHDLEFAPSLDIILNETLPALEALQKTGKVRHIGITGYEVHTLLEVVQKSRVKIDTVHCFCRYGLYNNDLLDIIPELRKRGVGIINAAPLGLGLLSKQGPEDWHPANEFLKIACRAAVAYAHEVGSDLEKVVLKLCYNSPDVDTTVASMVCVERPDLVTFNVHTVQEPMTDNDRNVVEDIKAKYFRALEKTHWEGEPVARYWEAFREEEALKKSHFHPLILE
ncbi:L-galactose dehydrogenase [Hypsibius exemplaris]|uniref:L-galactose dehydrogenase n=1 Tax=Hypsibius exemplaris TaxID=2072580 RepID=A0A9X6NH77_HYPEX|nr:L-galactose dehydrogenase [Hypsibius exemplaris]